MTSRPPFSPRAFSALASISLTVAALSGCDCAGSPSGACEGPSPAVTCGRPCSASAPCPGGFFCGTDDRCTAQCSGTNACAGGGICTSDGHCVGGSTDGSVEGGRDATPLDAPPADHTCASIPVTATLATPNVILIVDQSGSMGDNEFPAGSGTSRWEAVDAALLDNPDGLVFMLQGSVRFGLALYHQQGSTCPNTIFVPAELMSFTALETEYDSQSPQGGTPTGQSIDAVLASLDALVTHPDDPTIFVLATDGEPDTCEDGDDEVRGRTLSVAAVARAHDMGIDTYVVSVGEGVSRTHLQALANAGRPGAGDSPFYVATDTAGLTTALTTIVGGVVSCDVRLDGTINPAAACSGEVRLGGRVLTCDDPDGWHAVDATHIEITGDACDELLSSGGGLTASFPCGVVVI